MAYLDALKIEEEGTDGKLGLFDTDAGIPPVSKKPGFWDGVEDLEGICRKCGRHISESHAFCDNCGFRNSDSVVASLPQDIQDEMPGCSDMHATYATLSSEDEHPYLYCPDCGEKLS